MYKKILCISAAFILCFSSFVIPSYAVDNFQAVTYYSTAPSYSDLRSTGYLLRYISNTDRSYYIGSNNADTYVFAVNNSSIYAVSHLQSTISYTNLSSNTNVINSILNSYNSDYSFYYVSITNYSPDSYTTYYCNAYDSLESGFSALQDYINNPPSSDPVYNDLPDFYIQRGYAAYIDFGSDWSSRSCSGTFTSSFPQYSSLISGDWDGTDNRRYFWTDSMPSNTSFSSNVGSAIDWTKVAPYDLLQRSKNGIWFIQSNSPLNRYLVIVNPNQWRYGQAPTEDTLNSPIKVSDLSGSTGDVQFFALNQQFDQNGTLVSSASDDASNNRTGTYDPNTDTWATTDSSGNAADQVPGGMSDSPTITSIGDYIHSITSILTNFANSVISLIQAPISHVAELIEAGSGFMGALRGLYAWLPVDIQGLVISALTVVIGIGVFKVFL